MLQHSKRTAVASAFRRTPRLAGPARRRQLRRRLVVPVTAAAVAGAGLLAVPALAAPTSLSLLSTSGTTWSYLDDGNDPAAGSADRLSWTQESFDDGAWKSGVGAFGAKNGAKTGITGYTINTLLTQYYPNTTTDIPTYFLRTSFELTGEQLEDVQQLTGTAVYDDAASIYVNGQKAAGLSDSKATGNVSYAGDNLGNPVTKTFTVPADLLKEGENTVAVALHNGRPDSSDVFFDLTTLEAQLGDVAETTYSDIVLGVGGDQTERMVTWYSSADTSQVVQVAKAAEVRDGAFPASATTVPAAGGRTTSGEVNRAATLTGLAESTSYVYRVGSEGNWSETFSFRTQDFDGDFDFLFFGDPQLGASGNLANDAAGWADTLDVATAAYPDAELLFSSGDQVNTATSEAEYEAFLQPDALREIPFVATNGNHDVGSKAYEQHFATPNNDRTAGAGSTTASGGNYWFIHNDVLFMDINSNSRDHAAHIAWMNQVVAEHGDEATWKVLAFHHSIYSSGPHADDSDVIQRRADLPTAISELGIDVVLQGHDHTYARSYLLRNGEQADPAEQAGADSVVAGPGGVLYVTANSASGSKYYALENSGASYLSVYNQEKVRNYTAVEVTDEAINIKTLRSQAFGTSQVNSIVDDVTLTRQVQQVENGEQIEVTVPGGAGPGGAPGEFVWNIDGSNGLVDLGTAEKVGDHFGAEGSINPVRVTDTRSSGAGWSISAQVGDFVVGSRSFSGKYLGWTPEVVEDGGGAVAGTRVASGFDSGDGLSVSSQLGHADDGHQAGSARLGAGLELKVPLDVTDGTYRATLTLTALS